MPDMKRFDDASVMLRSGVERMPNHLEPDGMTAIRHEDDGTGQIDAILIYAWGESAHVVNRVLKLAPGQTPKYVRDSN